MLIYNSRNYKGVLISDVAAFVPGIYNSRNYKGVLIMDYIAADEHIYNSRNYKGVLIPEKEGRRLADLQQ